MPSGRVSASGGFAAGGSLHPGGKCIWGVGRLPYGRYTSY